MRAYRNRLTIQKLVGTDTADSRGRSQKVWTTVDKWQASIRRLTGRELEDARRIYHEATHQLDGHYVTVLSTHPQAVLLLFEGRKFRVGDIDNFEERNRTHTLLVTEFTT